MNIIVIRNDKIGDFMLSWPTLALIKLCLPGSHITVLVPEYTAPLAELCPWIDTVLIDSNHSPLKLAALLRTYRFDSMLTLYSTTRIGLAGLFARIPYRLAPATKIAQLFYSHRLTQRRSRSQKPEYAYNLDLAMQFLHDHHIHHNLQESTTSHIDWLPAAIHRPLLELNDNIQELRLRFCDSRNLDPSSRLIFIHPGSGGSANNLRPDQYAILANYLARHINCSFVVTAGPAEMVLANNVADAITAPVTVYESTDGLANFVHIMQCADLFISGSTGPLHIAGALNLNTAAFYPGHRSATPLRWQTLNAPDRRLYFVPPENSEHLVENIDIESSSREILGHFFQC